ncbi:sigma-70 family RNA polymerase sigma factor [Nannocystis pusilla]|uniref:Sigma-70 family RNA polymerase sigma factor n=1 Tax=Nannocystis pusilla TaxID=889268 RepID=A0ABS7TRA7_9BACT|nr:sigma-70 family RNA polymerase sigma factor [Nannocystis pusilla]MBZ5710787.1 sigma-70 family RNA polymerase sigma factor [Nannocystis pusilla]
MRSEPEDDARIRAFRELYRREFAFVWAVARRLGVPPALIEDAVQDVFLTAYRRLDEVRFEVSARAWLHGVTRNIVARYHRSAARLSRRLAAVAAVPRGPADPPQERLAAAEQLERLLERLSGSTRAAFEMSELFGMSGPEIASELGIPLRTVYSRVRLAREQLVREFGTAGLEHELAGARERDAPPPPAAQRSWAVLLPGLLPARAGVGLAALVSARTAVMTTLVLATGVVAVAWPRGPARERAAEDPPPSAPPVATTIVRPAPITDPLLPSAPPPSTPPAAVAPRRSDPDRLAAEVAVLDRARARLARGDIEAAEAHLDEHARRFPDGVFTDLRGATEVDVLCRRGRPVEAAARAADLLAAHPRSVVAQRYENFVCPE